MSISPQLQKYINIDSKLIKLENCLIGINIGDWWELIYRNNFQKLSSKMILLINEKVHYFEFYHKNLSAEPNKTKSIGLIKDISNDLKIEKWLANFCTNNFCSNK